MLSIQALLNKREHALLNMREIDFIKLRIIDFYFVFPHLIKEIKLPNLAGSSKLRAMSKSLDIPYEKMPDIKRLFSEMGDFQIQAMHILKAKNILDDQDGLISSKDEFYGEEITNLLSNSQYTSNELYINIVELFYKIPLYGQSGLKQRTGLMEYRYDPV
jgi:hypothetical protein